MKTILAIALLALVGSEAYAGSTYVRPYVRKNGTVVQGHVRTTPDHTKTNNYSYPGNYNPNSGTVTPSQPSYGSYGDDDNN